MKNFLLFAAALIMFSSCSDDTRDPDLRIYRATKSDEPKTIPVTVIDNHDGTGTIEGALLHNVGAQTSSFDADFDYVNHNKTNFILSTPDGEIQSIFSSGTGYMTDDSIYLSIRLNFGGFTLNDIYRGER